MTDLRDLLDVATDRVEAPGLAAGALATAGRRRRNRRAGAVASVAAAVVVAGVGLAGWVGSESSPSPAPDPAPSPTAVAPDIAAGRIQPVWDPRDAESRPVVELGVPRVMESLVPGTVEQPVALLDDGSRVLLVSAAGRSSELALPDGLGRWRTVSLSPDGARLAATGVGGFYWRTLDGDWQQVDVGEEQQVTGEGVSITWAPDSRSLVLRAHLDGVRVDLDSGGLTRLPMLRRYVPWAFAPDGAVVTTAHTGLREWVGGSPVRETALGDLESLARPAVSDTAVAATRGDRSWSGGQRGPADRDGLVAVDRGTLATRAFLPVPDAASWYSDGGHLSPVAWLDDDTVLFTVLPQDAPKEYLMAWDVETGEISRISCWLSSDDAVFATGLLGSP